jgi:hypothetical protein
LRLLGNEPSACQVADERFVDRRAGEVELVEVLGQRQLGDSELVLDRPGLLLGDLGAQEVADNARRLVATLNAARHHLVISGAHAEELEPRHQLEDLGALHQEAFRRLS